MLVAVMQLALLLSANPQEREPVGLGPAPAANPATWELEFRFLDPRRIEVKNAAGMAETYWYMVYTVTNTSARSQRFYPMFQLVTDDLKVFNTDIGISPIVFDAIKERHKVTHKFLVYPTEAIGALLSGADNARESVAVWRDIDLNVHTFTIYVAGLSGEVRRVPNPRHDPKQPETKKVAGAGGREREVETNPRYFTLRKTLEIGYTLPGSPQARPGVEPERGQVRWIMR